MQVPLWMVLSVSSSLFFIGFFGLIFRKNILVILMCLELMLNAVNLTFISFSKHLSQMNGQISALFIIIVAATESAVGLALTIALFRTLKSVNTDSIRALKEPPVRW